jgi:CHAP domain-containing protein
MPVLADDLIRVARAELGVHEQPDGTNRGPRVNQYQDVCTPGYHGYPWCVAFLQWVMQTCGVGPIANSTAGVYALLDWARKHGLARSKPQKGHLVCFIRGAGHIGIVEEVFANGRDFTTLEGNAANAVRRRQHSTAEPVAFVQVPGVTVKTKVVTQWLPRFEVTTSENGHARVLIKAGKWAKVGPQLPKLLKRYHTARLRRTVVKVQKRVPA